MSVHSLFRWERTDDGKDTLSLLQHLSSSSPFGNHLFGVRRPASPDLVWAVSQYRVLCLGTSENVRASLHEFGVWSCRLSLFLVT